MLRKIILTILFIPAIQPAKAGSEFWNDIHSVSSEIKKQADSKATASRIISLNPETLRNKLKDCPHVNNTHLRNSNFYIELPHPDGHTAVFRIIENQLLHPGLAAAYPELKTYSGQGVDDPAATLKFEITIYGFHAMVISPNGTYYINPLSGNLYMSFSKKHAVMQTEPMQCHFDEQAHNSEINQRIEEALQGNSSNRTIEGQLRMYRLALACTGEYATFHGGTKPSVLSAFVVAMNRVNGVYEREFGITMQLVPNDTLLIFLNATTDPYTNNNGGAMLGQNQTTCDNLIGNANYDIGHVFSTGGGGVAYLAVPCKTGLKAQGVTGLSSPVGDPFYIDYVAHEMGHQYGARHTFNSTIGGCNGNINPSTAWEPGSGSTIMAYAGLCGSQNLQNFSNDYFHTGSFDEIINYTQLNVGNTCPTISTVPNLAPVINALPSNQTIPLNTPFRLTASASDPNGDTITYCWEQYDLGPAGNWNAPTGNAPIFRSFLPVYSPTRLFPKILNILNNNTTIGEIKPSYARQLKFRCTVRDNILSGAGVTYNDTPVILTVDGNSGPFEVTYPNTTGIVWQGNSTQTVTWSVANTDQAPVNCQQVNILLSVDGGYNYPYTLATAVPNTGSYAVTVPNISTSAARVMVESNGNVFFDINNFNFSINPVSVTESGFASAVSAVYDASLSSFIIGIINQDKGPVRITITDMTGRLVYHSEQMKNQDRFVHHADVRLLTEGNYLVRVESGHSGFVVRRVFKGNF